MDADAQRRDDRDGDAVTVPAPGAVAVFLLGALETPTRCEVLGVPRSYSARVPHSVHEWYTVLVLPEGEREARPVCVSRLRP